MSIWEIILIVIGVIIISYLCNYCCRGKTQQGRILEAPVVITTTTSTNYAADPLSVGNVQSAPYPPAMPTSGQFNPPYPTSYPTAQPIPSQGLVSYPAAPGFQPNIVSPPYPAFQNPPSYDQAVVESVNGKQAPYNPHYIGN